MASPEPSHPEPACLEAQKWIEAVTGKSFGDKDFRSALENGILLCELLSAIKPGLVKKINRLPTPIAGLDNLSVFLRGCEELGLKGSQLFDPGDLQDTSIRANLKDSDCNRKLKNVLNTVFWLGKAASGCATYSGPNLNLKEFEGLLAQMKLESDEGGDSSQKRSVRDSGYDCWDSERSESLSPPRHTRDNSLDSLDSFGSRSQHSPSPDVVNRGNSDGRGSDSEADASGRKPDVRKDDMLARRTASSESRCPVPFNQFLPNRTNASCYIPAPRRKQHTEEGEQRRSVSMGDMASEEEAGHLPSLSPSRYERMHQQYCAFLEEEDHWQDDLARWKSRRRSASQELIKKEEERKRMEKRMKEYGVDGNKRKSIKTYREIVEEKERREAELCEAYRNAATPEEAAMVLQRYALRFTISDATLDSLKLPRSTNKPKRDLNRTDQEPKPTSAVINSERLDPPSKLDSDVLIKQERSSDGDVKTEGSREKEESGVISPSSSTPDTNSRDETRQSEELHEPPSHLTDPQPERQKQPDTGPPPPRTETASSQPVPPKHEPPSPLPAPSRPLPLLVAKPYCPPKSSPSGHKHVHVQKMDEAVRLNGETTEDFPSLQDSLQESKDVSSEETQKHDPPEETVESPTPAEQLEAPQQEKATPTAGSAISSLIAGRSCIITTTIVTELTKTHVEPLHPDVQNNGQDGTAEHSERPTEEEKTEPAQSPSSMQDYSPTVTEGVEDSSVTIETPMLNLAKRVNHWVWDPNEERKRLERWQQEQERLLQEQYQKEQEKLKKEWEKAQLEVEEEERKHNEEERRILEETVAPLSPSALLQKQSEQTTAASFSEEENTTTTTTTVGGNMSLQQNGQEVHTGTQDQHASKLHFLQDSGFDDQPAKKQEMWKTASLDRSPQLNQTQAVKRSESHDAVTSNPDLSPSTPQPLSHNRCVSGKRLCSGCSKPLGRGAAMIIDTLGLFFHMQCFKCGVCKGQLGDATAGTDVRIRNGLLSCYECYIASRGRGQPTPL
ncbi:LIM and calponin homology domains-containing protein 1-like isoform 3-T3 [Fundulus diaphanus]